MQQTNKFGSAINTVFLKSTHSFHRAEAAGRVFKACSFKGTNHGSRKRRRRGQFLLTRSHLECCVRVGRSYCKGIQIPDIWFLLLYHFCFTPFQQLCISAQFCSFHATTSPLTCSLWFCWIQDIISCCSCGSSFLTKNSSSHHSARLRVTEFSFIGFVRYGKEYSPPSGLQ